MNAREWARVSGRSRAFKGSLTAPKETRGIAAIVRAVHAAVQKGVSS